MASTQKDPAAIETAKSLANVPWSEEYEKMISGMLYDAQIPDLVAARFKARRFMSKYNTHFPDDATPESLVRDREEMLKGILGGLGTNAFIEPPVNIDYGCNIKIGDNFYSNFNIALPFASLVVLDCSIVTIGNRVNFGPFVSIFAATHETEVQSRRDAIEFAKPVVIGDDCWIGGNTTIMPGVTIGKGQVNITYLFSPSANFYFSCTIGASSVVTKDIPDFSVAIGSPARVVKKVTPVPNL
ncbi:hypothetical protein E0Z10_g4821 [Xylaria hypoxylon]|uniref:Maltose/galactoside acetyltransferase domain-containing protein n=1 Tax=Xylaria hypoxylon TaxID=37992 RepID=A0A4Z0Z324_9PEZI|nr:hypothetical protein E0Z10_g4821 [Xylaria hypoxylon]